MKEIFEYTAVIRTLGTAGEKYQKLLDSLNSQTIKPKKILVYIAEGYSIPIETIGLEQYIYVKKGMVSQRALPYDEVDSKYILFLDDDLCFPSDTVERMFALLHENNADVISPDIYPNAKRPFFHEMLMTLSGRMRARRNDNYWGYKVMRNSGYSYNKYPNKEVYWSQTNAGACFMCSKKVFLSIKFSEELWMDRQKYALGDDQVMFYKMYLYGYKILTWYNHGFVHLDGGNNMEESKREKLIYSDFYFKMIFWHRYIYMPDRYLFSRILSLFSILYLFIVTLLISFVKFDFRILKLKCKAIFDAIYFIESNEYSKIPLVTRIV